MSVAMVNDMRRIAFLALSVSMLMLLSCNQHTPESVAAGRTKAEVNLVCLALESYHADHAALPKELDGFGVLIGERAYLRTSDALIDGWHRPIHPLVKESMIVGAASPGMDGKVGTVDDVQCLANLDATRQEKEA